ncbi:MAG: type II toxin-antitoxin system VapC family toxin [bacterium]
MSLYEVFKLVLQQSAEGEALQAVATMQQGTISDLSAPVALSAARLSHELKIPMADSIMLATARAWDATLWTQDSDFSEIPDVRYVDNRTKGSTANHGLQRDADRLSCQTSVCS